MEALFSQFGCQVRWSRASGLGVSDEYHRHAKLLKTKLINRITVCSLATVPETSNAERPAKKQSNYLLMIAHADRYARARRVCLEEDVCGLWRKFFHYLRRYPSSFGMKTILPLRCASLALKRTFGPALFCHCAAVNHESCCFYLRATLHVWSTKKKKKKTPRSFTG